MNRKINIFTAFMIILATIITYLCILHKPDVAICIALAEKKDAPKIVYLTFDDGPSDRVTPTILDILDEENVKATFFIIGKNAERRDYLIKREHLSGHTVAVHSYTHEYGKIYSSPENLLKDIDKCNEVIKSITGEYSTLYRFPGGSYGLDGELIKSVCSHGMRYVDWNASCRDAEIWNATPEELFKAAKNTSSDQNSIVLLAHDSTSKSTTAKALKDIICYYKSQGYVFDTFKNA